MTSEFKFFSYAFGSIFKKVGGLAISTVGGGITCITILQQLGYITVDWKKLQKDYNKLRNRSSIDLSRVPGKDLIKVKC